MTRNGAPIFLSIAILAAAAVISLTLAVDATSRSDITYPVQELGGCRNDSECRAFCDARDDIDKVRACVAFAKQHNLLTSDELEESEHYVLRLGIAAGPGGCKNGKECEAYCEDTEHLAACLDFAEKYNLRSREEIAEGRKLAVLIQTGTDLPGGCRTKSSCESYCEDPLHMKECVAFAEKAGFISSEEAESAQKIIPLLEAGEKTPGNCGRKAACEAYCTEASHIDECLAFAEKANLLSAEELADAKKFAPYIKQGETPGQCKRKDECESYCSDTAHFEECVLFAEKAGILSREDAELARKVKGQGPGGCISLESCEAYCGKPENQEACISFAKEHGLTGEIQEVEQKIRGEMENKMKTCAEKSCAEFIPCLQSLNEGSNDRGDTNLPSDIQSKLNICIEEMKAGAVEGKSLEGGSDARESAGSAIPTDAYCRNYCTGQYANDPTAYDACLRSCKSGAVAPAVSGEAQQKASQTPAESQYTEEYQKQYDAATQQYCPSFASVPACSYVGSPDSQNYQICKKCFPDK